MTLIRVDMEALHKAPVSPDGTAFIWAGEIVKNDFKCDRCGERVGTEEGEPIEEKIKKIKLPNIAHSTFCLCVKCETPVGVVSEL